MVRARPAAAQRIAELEDGSGRRLGVFGFLVAAMQPVPKPRPDHYNYQIRLGWQGNLILEGGVGRERFLFPEN